MPPGSYHFWRFGMVSPLIRWAFTIGACFTIIMMWYLISTRLLLRSASDELWCAQCTAQLAELSVSGDEPIEPIDTLENQAMFALLNACEKSGLTVQSSTCQKPIKKNTVTLQRINLICTGSLEQIKLFLNICADGALACAHLETHITKQQENLYKTVFSLEVIPV